MGHDAHFSDSQARSCEDESEAIEWAIPLLPRRCCRQRQRPSIRSGRPSTTPSDESRPLVLAGVRWATRRRFDPRSSPSWKKNHIRNQFRITGSLGLIPFHDPEKPRCRISTGPTIPIIATRSIKFRTASPCEYGILQRIPHFLAFDWRSGA